MEETIDVPLEGSSFLRHFAVPYEQVKDKIHTEVTTMIHPDIGWYKSSANRKQFPFLNDKNPIDAKINAEDVILQKVINNYEDLFYCRRSPENESIRLLYCCHALNHSLKCRKLVIKNNEKEKQSGVSDSLRDQGFHRARTLILAPTKEAARRIVQTFLKIMPKGSTVCHRRRFEQDFGPQPGDTDKVKKKGRKPKDYEEWFSGNSSDHFRIGISFSKKSVKLYSAFSNSDIILASPLGLQTIIDGEQEADIQYIIASIELLIIDQAEMLLMQNWSTVQHIVSLLNQRPTKPVFASAARIRLSYLAGYGKRYRQTLLFSAVSTFLLTLLSGECENFQGMNYIPPVSCYNDLYPTFLPEWQRVPGLKPPVLRSGQKRQHSETDVSEADDKSINYNFKLHLISFLIPGQISVKSSSGTKLANENQLDSSDSDSEEKQLSITPPLPISSSKHLPTLDTTTNSLLLSCKPLTFTNHAYMSGRNISIARLNAFKQRILPRLRQGSDPRVLIYVTDFYDLEELRQILRAESLDFCCINEYTEDSEAERFRTLFSHGRIRIMLITERYFFFRRRKIRGPQTFIFYGPPTFPWFVKELYDFRYVEDNAQYNMTILYSPLIESHTVSMITGSIEC
ncbi:unnamed protein product [Trichobilharzia szidati]|nr:unnamed protein product [Trichobilharzia szidati]